MQYQCFGTVYYVEQFWRSFEAKRINSLLAVNDSFGAQIHLVLSVPVGNLLLLWSLYHNAIDKWIDPYSWILRNHRARLLHHIGTSNYKICAHKDWKTMMNCQFRACKSSKTDFPIKNCRFGWQYRYHFEWFSKKI